MACLHKTDGLCIFCAENFIQKILKVCPPTNNPCWYIYLTKCFIYASTLFVLWKKHDGIVMPFLFYDAFINSMQKYSI